MKNKKINTVLFILCGTVVNLLLAIVCIVTLLVAVHWLVVLFGPNLRSMIPLALIGGIIIAMIVYQRLTRWVVDRFKLADKLTTLFPSRKDPPKKD